MLKEFFEIPFKTSFEVDAILLFLTATIIIATSIRLIISNNLLESVVITSVFSLFIGICYLIMDAPDVAMTEAALGACLSSCVLLNLIKIFGAQTVPARRSRTVFASILCLVLIVSLTWAALDLPMFGQEDSPLQMHLTKYYIENTKHDIRIKSIVAAILASYRGYDTLGETTVILLAGLAVLTILSSKKENYSLATTSSNGHVDKNLILKNYLILKTIISLMIPYIALYAIYIQLNGEASPGGGFQAGVIFATGIIAYDLSFGSEKLQEYFSQKSLIICATLGVMIYAGTGFVSLIFDDNYLNYNSIALNPITGQHIGIFSIELGVGMTVSSVMILIYSLLREE